VLLVPRVAEVLVLQVLRVLRVLRVLQVLRAVQVVRLLRLVQPGRRLGAAAETRTRTLVRVEAGFEGIAAGRA